MKIYLVGMMGSGKTTVAKKLARLLSYSYLDMDEYIEQKEARTIKQLFDGKGEASFRELENYYLKDVLSQQDVVVSTGGGLPCHHNHMDLMNESGITIYLEADVRFLRSRLVENRNDRPLLTTVNDDQLEDYLNDLLNIRKGIYTQATLILASKNLKPKDIVSKLESMKLSY